MLNKEQAQRLVEKIIKKIQMNLYLLEPGTEQRFLSEISCAIHDMDKLVDLYLEESNVDLESVVQKEALAYAMMFVLSDNIEEFEIFSKPQVFYHILERKCGEAGKKFYEYIENGHKLYELPLEQAAEYISEN